MKVTQFKDDLFILDNEVVKVFLITSNNEALLFDSGFKEDEILKEVRKITDAKIKLILTHGDRDHTGGTIYFDECYINENDQDMLECDITKHNIKNDDFFICGNYRFKAIELYGHTKGSMAFLDEESGILISGDSIQDMGPIYMFGSHRNLDNHIESLKNLLKYKDKIKIILPSHHNLPLTSDFIEKNLIDAIALKEGKLKSKKVIDKPCLEYFGKYVNFYY